MTLACTRCGLFHPAGSPCLALTLPAGSSQDTLTAGTLLAGRYSILRTIHRGGMSVVYLAEDALRQGRWVVLKELRLPDGAEPEDRREAEAWFARESYLLSSLRSPLIPLFYSVFQEGGHSYIVQEYVAGENLDQVVARRGPLDEDLVISWGVALCDLLTYLHDQDEPVVYRDLKPANILLRDAVPGSSAGECPLAVVDFGIARPFRQGEVGTVIGTPGYAPPEQYQGLATPQSDVYALGATLHRLLTGYDPEHGTPFSFPPVRQLNPQVSPELAAVVERAVRLDPAARYPSAVAMGEALQELAWQSGDWMGLSGIGSRGARVAPNGRVRWIGLAASAFLLGPMLLSAVGSFVDRPAMAPMPLGMTPQWSDGQGQAQDQDNGSGLQMLTVQPPSLLPECLVSHARLAPAVWGPDGNLWFTRFQEDTIGRLSPSGKFTEFPLPTPDAGPAGIAVGADGGLWFTEMKASQVGRITTNSQISEFPLSTANSAPYGITAGPDGAMWFTEANGDRIGRVTPDGKISEVPLPSTAADGSASEPTGITKGADGNLWFTEYAGNRIGQVTPGGAIHEFPLPSISGPSTIVAAPDHSLWFMENDAQNVGHATLDGNISEYALSAPGAGSASIDTQGTLWFAEDGLIGHITSDGLTGESPVSGMAEPFTLTRGPDGKVWLLSQDQFGWVSPNGTFHAVPILPGQGIDDVSGLCP